MSEVGKLLETIDQRGYSHIIFDMDATLTLLNMPWDEWVELIARRLPAEVADSFRRAILAAPGAGWGQIANDHIESHQSFLPALLEASEEFESTYFAHTPHDELVQAVHELAKNGKTLYIWTGNMRSTAEKALTELGIRHLFKQIVSREDVRQTKPHPEGWQLLERGIARTEYLFVGDSGNDKGAAETLEIDYFEITFFHQNRH